MHGQSLRLVLEERIGCKCPAKVHDEVVDGAVPGMHQVGLVLQQVVYALDDIPLPEHDFVPHGHELVLHVGLQPVHEVYALPEEFSEEFLLYVSAVGEDLPVEFPGKNGPHAAVPVIHVRGCKCERYDFPAVVAQQVQLEAVAPSHRALAVPCHAPEHPVRIAAQVVADGYHRGVHEADTAAPAEGLQLQEEHQGEEHAGHQLDKAVVGHGTGKIAPHVLPYV